MVFISTRGSYCFVTEAKAPGILFRALQDGDIPCRLALVSYLPRSYIFNNSFNSLLICCVVCIYIYYESQLDVLDLFTFNLCPIWPSISMILRTFLVA